MCVIRIFFLIFFNYDISSQFSYIFGFQSFISICFSWNVFKLFENPNFKSRTWLKLSGIHSLSNYFHVQFYPEQWMLVEIQHFYHWSWKDVDVEITMNEGRESKLWDSSNYLELVSFFYDPWWRDWRLIQRPNLLQILWQELTGMPCDTSQRSHHRCNSVRFRMKLKSWRRWRKRS